MKFDTPPWKKQQNLFLHITSEAIERKKKKICRHISNFHFIEAEKKTT